MVSRNIEKVAVFGKLKNTNHCIKNKVFHQGFLQQMGPNPDLATFTEEILNEKLHFLCSEYDMSRVWKCHL